MELIGNIKNYDWGKQGELSEVAQLAKTSGHVINPNNTYAELWMGDHSSGPSTIKASGQELGQVIKQRLPYLFKVLSIRKALSIQVHPNKEEAVRLHNERPDVYKDPNHKPELAIALTPFKALCGFRPYQEIYTFCLELPPLKVLLGDDNAINGLSQGSIDDMKKCYQTLMKSTPEHVKVAINAISEQYAEVLTKFNLYDVFTTISNDFPGDIGVLSLFFLNLVNLQPGESIYLGANEIHAYIFGDCVECMACSDNVIRAGLTPKYKDVQTLLASLNYTGSPASSKIFTPRKIDDYCKVFSPPVKDFAVVEILLPSIVKNSQTIKLPKTPGILLVLNGSRTLRLQGQSDIVLNRGSIVFVPPENMDNIELSNGNKNNESDMTFIAYLATENSF